jgi:hypothetical protein
MHSLTAKWHITGSICVAVLQGIGTRLLACINIIKDYKMQDESHLPVSEQSLVFRLRKRAEIRRKSVEEGKPDRIADLLEEAANEIVRLQIEMSNYDE